MSDPVTNVEIEDVLSSIRRLVSSEERPLKAEDVAPESDAQTPTPEADKLVLTPFFRVDDSEDAQASDAKDAPEGGMPAREKVLPEVGGEALGDDSDIAADEASDDPAQGSPVWDDSVPERSEMECHWDVENAAEGAVADLPERSDALKARVAEFEQVVASRDDQWEPDGTTDEAYSGGPGASVPWEDYQADADAAEAEAAKPSEPAPKRRQVTPSAPVDDIPENFVAEDPRAEEDDSPSDAALLGDTEDVLDEDALRDLVADIVRQELQGALGERITRNVRKLVRREIARALASQDLD